VSVEQIEATTKFAQTVGVPTFIIVAFMVMLAFVFVKFVWPWITKRIERQDAEYSKRHEGYIAEQKANIEENKATTQVLIMMQQKLDGHEEHEAKRDVDLREMMNRRFDELMRAVLEMNRR
jgi:uncharacterized membrane protein YhiD involved in acid resistance